MAQERGRGKERERGEKRKGKKEKGKKKRKKKKEKKRKKKEEGNIGNVWSLQKKLKYLLCGEKILKNTHLQIKRDGGKSAPPLPPSPPLEKREHRKKG